MESGCRCQDMDVLRKKHTRPHKLITVPAIRREGHRCYQEPLFAQTRSPGAYGGCQAAYGLKDCLGLCELDAETFQVDVV